MLITSIQWRKRHFLSATSNHHQKVHQSVRHQRDVSHKLQFYMYIYPVIHWHCVLNHHFKFTRSTHVVCLRVRLGKKWQYRRRINIRSIRKIDSLLLVRNECVPSHSNGCSHFENVGVVVVDSRGEYGPSALPHVEGDQTLHVQLSFGFPQSYGDKLWENEELRTDGGHFSRPLRSLRSRLVVR